MIRTRVRRIVGVLILAFDFGQLSILEWAVLGIAGLFSIGVIFAFMVNFNDSFNDAFQESDQIDQEVKDFYSEQNVKLPKYLDSLFFASFVILFIACILVARATGISGVLWPFLFVMFMVLGLIAAWISNAYGEFQGGLSVSVEVLLPWAYHVLDNFLTYVLVLLFGSLFFSRVDRGDL